MFDTGTGDTDGIDLLKRIIADQVGRNLAGEYHQGDRVHIGGGDPGDAIGHPGPGRD
jgi:hypothetical protein